VLRQAGNGRSSRPVFRGVSPRVHARSLLLLCLPFLLPFPARARASESCQVWLNGEAIEVIDTAVNHRREWTSRPILDTTPVAVTVLDGPAEVEVCFPGVPLETAVVRPLSLGITPAVEGDRVRFALEGPANVTVEYNGQVRGALHLFAAAPDTEKPDPNDPGVIYFGAGLHEAGIVRPQSGQTVYLDEGCVLRGAIHADGVTNVRVAGPGILDGSTFDRWKDILVPIDFAHSDHITIEGVTILDPAAWTLNLCKSGDVVVDGVKIVGARANSDGITIQSCERVQVRDCFVRGWDDNLVVKGYDGDARDIAFENCVLWTDLAQSCEIGYETRADVIERITFRDITVLHNFHKPVMSIHNSDNALVQDVLFENIVVEDAQMGRGDGANFLIDLTTTKSQWSKTAERGNIRRVTFDGVTVLDGVESAIRIFSFRKAYNVDDIVLRNITLFGEKITDFSQIRMNVNKHNGVKIAIE